MNKNRVKPPELIEKIWRNPDMNDKQFILNKYNEDYCNVAIEILAQGKSYAALAAHLDVSQKTIENWRKQYPEFDDACLIGKDKGQAWWENNSDENMENKDYSSVRYIFKMKSQYKVRDGSEPLPVQAHIGTEAGSSMDAQELFKAAVAQARERGDLK